MISLILQSNRFQSSIQEYLESGRQRVWSVFLLNSETETYVDICLTSKRTGPLVIRTHWFLLLKPNPTDYMAEPFYSGELIFEETQLKKQMMQTYGFFCSSPAKRDRHLICLFQNYPSKVGVGRPMSFREGLFSV